MGLAAGRPVAEAIMNPRLGLTRNIIKPTYALITPDGHVASVLPGWSGATINVLISATLGAGFSQYLAAPGAGGRGDGSTEEDEWFFYVVAGEAAVNGVVLETGAFAYVPPETTYEVVGRSTDAKLLVFRKQYEPLAEYLAPAFFTGQERHVTDTPFLGDPHARLKVLIPDTPGADMAVNVFTYDPGATLPFVETHVMEHGMLFLEGSGVYRLDEDWHPVSAGDALWIAPYCPQWFIAAGPGPARYIYYKDVNRLPL
jgi:(S)-ureidoglycine aminohydrolase